MTTTTITTVFFAGKWWTRIQPAWLKGRRPTVTYREKAA